MRNKGLFLLLFVCLFSGSEKKLTTRGLYYYMQLSLESEQELSDWHLKYLYSRGIQQCYSLLFKVS